MCTRLEAKMKYLLSVSALLTFVLSGCINVPESAQENIATAFAEDLQEGTPAETNTGEDVSTASIEVVGGNEESLREFIKQWFMPVYPGQTLKPRLKFGCCAQLVPMLWVCLLCMRLW